jgi:uncharacterized protein YkwD
MHKRIYTVLPIVLAAAFLITFAGAGCESAPPGTGHGTTTGTGTGTSTGTGTGTGTSTDTITAQVEQEFVKQLNVMRKAEGLNELVWCDHCAADAYVEAADNAKNEKLDHDPCPKTCPIGFLGMIVFVSDAKKSASAQADYLLQGYYNSAVHRKNMMNPRATGIGCACVLNDSGSWNYHSAHFH